MPTSYLEIVQLENGDFALQRSGEDEHSLVTISFSEEAKAFLKEHTTTVARTMIGAGIEMVGDLSHPNGLMDEELDNATIH